MDASLNLILFVTVKLFTELNERALPLRPERLKRGFGEVHFSACGDERRAGFLFPLLRPCSLSLSLSEDSFRCCVAAGECEGFFPLLHSHQIRQLKPDI